MQQTVAGFFNRISYFYLRSLENFERVYSITYVFIRKYIWGFL